MKLTIDSIKESFKSNNSILKIQKRFKREKHNVFTEEIKEIALRSNDDKIMKSIDSIETYAYRKSEDLVSDND